MCLAVAVWAPGNEKVIAKIQGLGEGHMTEIMKSIEEVSGLPAGDLTGKADDSGHGEHAAGRVDRGREEVIAPETITRLTSALAALWSEGGSRSLVAGER
jgi:hypothetical protein